jgi:hypothetical protein
MTRGSMLILPLLMVFALRPVLCQILIVTPAPARISVHSLDSVIARARNEALRTSEPALEFEIVRLHIVQQVESQRVNTVQEVSFDNADAFRSWLRGVSKRVNRPYNELLFTIVDSVRPSAVPDLTGETTDSPDYLHHRAMDNIQRNRALSEPPVPDHLPVVQNAGPDHVSESGAEASTTKPALPKARRSPSPHDATTISVEFAKPERRAKGKTSRSLD